MKVVPDANIVIALVLPVAYSEAATRKMQEWQDGDVEMIVPTLWSYEVVSTLRKAVATQTISNQMAVTALQDILSLEIREISPTPALHQEALVWALRLNQIVAYDAAYLALAELEGAEFWTADQRLVSAARNSGVSWVHHIEET